MSPCETVNVRIKTGKAELKGAQETMRNLGKQIAEKELKVSTLEGDLRIEREWRQSLQESDMKDKEEICKLNMEIKKLHLLKTVIMANIWHHSVSNNIGALQNV